MGAILSILKLEIKSYLTNTSALFWTFIYPILMLLLLIFVFSKNTTEIFYFNNIIGLMGLLIISSAIFGLTQAITSSRSHNIFLFYMLSPATFKQITLALIASR
ncbi:ABC transporter permease, partial [Helicobacter pylori]|nr:ABC transporter permease [Helicobacter pylori]